MGSIGWTNTVKSSSSALRGRWRLWVLSWPVVAVTERGSWNELDLSNADSPVREVDAGSMKVDWRLIAIS